MLSKPSGAKSAYRMLFVLAGLTLYSSSVHAQHNKVPKEPFQVVDASTGETISEILAIPLYYYYAGIFIAPEGPSWARSHAYLDHPFIYRSGEPFRIKQPRVFTGLPLVQVFIGQGRDLEGMLVVAPGYRPLWTNDLWCCPYDKNYERKLTLTPLSNEEWLRILQTDLRPFLNGAERIRDNCQLWNLDEKCNLKLKYDKKERNLMQSFLQRTSKATK